MGDFCITSTEENSDKSSFVWFWCWLTMMNQLTGAPAAEPPDPGQELLLLLLPHPLIPSCGQSQGKPASGSSARTNTSERCASHAAKPQLKLLQKCQYYSCCFCLHAIATKSGSVLQLSWFGSPLEILGRIQTVFSCYNQKTCLGVFTGPFFGAFYFISWRCLTQPCPEQSWFAAIHEFQANLQPFSDEELCCYWRESWSGVQTHLFLNNI